MMHKFAYVYDQMRIKQKMTLSQASLYLNRNIWTKTKFNK